MRRHKAQPQDTGELRCSIPRTEARARFETSQCSEKRVPDGTGVMRPTQVATRSVAVKARSADIWPWFPQATQNRRDEHNNSGPAAHSYPAASGLAVPSGFMNGGCLEAGLGASLTFVRIYGQPAQLSRHLGSCARTDSCGIMRNQTRATNVQDQLANEGRGE